ncbi:hypothetical protein [Gloeothece verrucosa]|uniref:Biopolymer transport protein ExbD/TolR n=1 Tax=Gloeothece verrucosa (strain PCC 7822) TaxID=497965 RepID=E0UDB2_GLOV7|nr:hypothetical protein [Gloeothece verrucosa]ADN14103.1 conserved hypothetical protein [Gloeothece verrucosa PCC 7822]
MRRRRFSRSSTEVELFPFLSILACTIGTLILLIIVLTTQMFGEDGAVTIVAKGENGKNSSKLPNYIECKGDGVIIYPSKKLVKKANLYSPSSPFKTLLEKVKNHKNKEYLIVVVRPDGFDIFQEIREVIEKQGIDMGYEPIEEGIKVKFEAKK